MLIFIAKLLLIALVAILIFLILMVTVPVNFRFRGNFRESEKHLTAAASLLFGAVRIFLNFDFPALNLKAKVCGRQFPLYRQAIGKVGGGKAKQRSGKAEPSPAKPKKRAGLGTTDWIQLVRQLLPRLLRPIRFRILQGDLGIGFRNPAATGLLYGAYSMFKYRLSQQEDITLRANFTQPGIDGEIESAGVIYLHQYIPILIFCYKQYRRRLRIRKEVK